jgi:prepilin-type N-terminal cleavage/methylation domain-containing protein
MISLKKNSRGFTIVELLIVIVVIGILAALVITTYNGIQEKARDTKRKTDVNALQGQAEAYQAQNGKYPSVSQYNDSTFRSANMKGLDPAAMQDPKWASNNANCTTSGAAVLQGSATPASGCYGYAATPSGCDNGSNGDCTGYTLTANLEAGGTYTKQSLN